MHSIPTSSKKKRFFAFPVFADEEQTRIAGILYIITLSMLGVAVLAAGVGLIFGWLQNETVALTIGGLTALVALLLVRRGRLKLAG